MTTEERLASMEAELMRTKAGLAAAKRWNRWMLFMVALVGVGLGLSWALPTNRGITRDQEAHIAPNVVRANQFIVEDAKGKRRASLEVIEVLEDSVDVGGSRLTLYDANGTERATLDVRAASSIPEGFPPGGNASLFLTGDVEGDCHALLSAQEGQQAVLGLYGVKGDDLVLLSTEPGWPPLAIYNANRNIIWAAP